MVLLLFGHRADALRSPHRLSEVFETIGAGKDLDTAVLCVRSLYDEPILTELFDQRSDLRVVQRRDAAAAWDAFEISELAHCDVLRACCSEPKS